MRRKFFFTNVLLVLVLTFSVCLSSTSFVIADNSQETKITVTDFNETNWTQNLPIPGSSMDFVSTYPGSIETSVSTKTPFTGSYSVEFSVSRLDGVSRAQEQIIVALGATNLVNIPFNKTQGYWGAEADAVYIGMSDTKIYILSRESGYYEDKDSTANDIGVFWKHMYTFGDQGLTLSNSSIKLEVVSGDTADTLNIYVKSSSSESFSLTPQSSVTLHQKDIADGYLQVGQMPDEFGTFYFGYSKYNSHRVSNFSANGEILVKEDLEVLGNTDLVTISNMRPIDSITIYDKDYQTSNVISNFAINDSSLSDGDEVFSLTFKGLRVGDGSDNYWGLVLGVDDLSSGTEIRFDKTSKANHVYHSTNDLNVNNGNWGPATTIYTLKGYKGGTVVLNWVEGAGCSEACGHSATYTDVDFNGKIEFKIFSQSNPMNDGYFWHVNNISLTAETKAVEYCTVTTIVDGTETPASVEKGTAFNPEAPVKQGEIFIGWAYADSDESGVYKPADLSIDSVDEDITLTALFVDLHVFGASVKVTGTKGLRFCAQMSDESKALLDNLSVDVNFGILLSNDDLGTLDVPCVNWFNAEQTMYTAVLTDLNETYAATKFTAQAYVEVDGVKYYSIGLTRSISFVANEVVNDYRTQEEGGYVYELEDGKFYDVNYSVEAFKYLKDMAQYFVAE